MVNPETWYSHDVTWWALAGVSAAGDPTFAAPVPIKGHWREHREIFVAADGSEKVSKSIVHVDRDLAEGDFILLGLTTNADPFAVSGERIEGWRKSRVPFEDVHVRRAYLT